MPPKQTLAEDAQPKQILSKDTQLTQTLAEHAQPAQMLSVQPKQIREVQQENDQPGLAAQEPRLEPPSVRSENPSLLAKEDTAPASQEDISREAPQPEDRDAEPTREQLKQAQKLLFELQQANAERFQQLDQDQRRLTGLAELISKAIERDDKKAGDLAQPGSLESPRQKAQQPLREVEPEQMQKVEEKHQMSKHAGERRAFAEVFKVFKKMS